MSEKSIMLADSPLRNINCSFGAYLTQKKAEHSKHMLGNGISDYAYKTDLELRKKLDAVPGLFKIAQSVSASCVAQKIMEANADGLAVGPNQFPEVYNIACDCAKRLGISVPHIYIINSEELNAYTLACDDVEPVIIIYSLMLKRMTLGELKCVIAHECGHIHNYHGTYSVLSGLMINAGALAAYGIAGSLLAQLQQILTQGVQFTLKMWSRAAEVTADRAALICCDNVEDAYSVNKKLLYGGIDYGDKITTDLDIASLKEQLNLNMNNATRLIELNADHPLSIKRILAEMEFAQCELFYDWRPDLKEPGQIVRSKELTDERCKKYIDVVKGGDRK